MQNYQLAIQSSIVVNNYNSDVQEDFGQHWLRSKCFQSNRLYVDIFPISFIKYLIIYCIDSSTVSGDLRKLFSLNQLCPKLNRLFYNN